MKAGYITALLDSGSQSNFICVANIRLLDDDFSIFNKFSTLIKLQMAYILRFRNNLTQKPENGQLGRLNSLDHSPLKLIKVYVSLFICMAINATDLELVSELTTYTFIATLKICIARRGKHSNIFYYNGLLTLWGPTINYRN